LLIRFFIFFFIFFSQCGSCWAFSATEAVESAWILAGNSAVALAPQQIVDCDTAGSDQGCNGKKVEIKYQSIKKTFEYYAIL
jgi:hypothetical protein